MQNRFLYLGIIASAFFIIGCTLPTSFVASPSELNITAISNAQCVVHEPCEVQVARATGGTPPYTFVSDSFATGATPIGTIVNMNGSLTGTPSREGTYSFGICVKDLTSTSKCTQTQVTVNSATQETQNTNSGNIGGTQASGNDNDAARVGVNASTNLSASVDSANCTYNTKLTFGDHTEYIFTIQASGTVTAPPGTELHIFTGKLQKFSVPSWTGVRQRSETEAKRAYAVDPATTTWSASGQVSVKDWQDTGLGDNHFPVGVHIYIDQDQESNPSLNENKIVTCVIPQESTVNVTESMTRGCNITAGEVWCDVKQKCIYPLIESCEAQSIPPATPATVTVASATCSPRERLSCCGVVSWTIDSTGTASGPVSTSLTLNGDLLVDCGQWGSNCQRDEGEPESTNWHTQANGAVGLTATVNVEAYPPNGASVSANKAATTCHE
ncbi:MAG: hypothetical protein V1722_03540 [Candidatus Micrarchaeota archaeon]